MLHRRNFLRTAAALTGAATFCPQNLWAEVAPGMLVRSDKPLNAEPPLADLVKDFFTPVESFFIRSHGNTPEVDIKTYRLRVEGLVGKPLDLTFSEVKEKFRSRTVAATITCAGNRRIEMSAVKPISGVQWDAGAISTAEWIGATLAEILQMAEIKPEAKHVWFDGLDDVAKKDGGFENFGGSIPIEKIYGHNKPTGNVMSADPVLVAYHMAGKPLSPDHGYPLRTIVPGFIGARSVKWLGKITVSDQPSPNHYVADAYKVLAEDTPAEQRAKDPIYETVTNAAICLPSAGAKLSAGKNSIAGYAFAAGLAGNRIKQVEVSIDHGRTWTKAMLGKKKAGAFTWDLWTADIVLPAGDVTVSCRATDESGFTMPAEKPWNAKGYLFNSWHQVVVSVQ